jgi:GNAT superfamily N-acetyltransferase
MAFGDWMRRRAYGEPMPRRTRANVLSNRARDPAGCFVADVDSQTAGYIFSRTWGHVGWFGALGVHPQFQGRGIGRALILASVDYLDRRGCTTIGLGTMPEESKNVALYARCGFRPDYLTVALSWPAASAARLPDHALWSDLTPRAQGRLARETLPRISAEARPGMDLTPEIRAAAADGWGETLLLGEPDEPLGFCLVRTQTKWENRPLTALSVEVGALAAGEEDQLDNLLTLLADQAARLELPHVLLPVNTTYWATLEHLLALGCRIAHTRLRMVLRQQPPRPNAVDLSTWAA